MAGGGGGRLFEAGRLLTFSAFRMGAYSRWALIRGWALIRINTLPESRTKDHFKQYTKFGTGSFTIIVRNIKAIFREYFSSLRFDSGKILMIIIFSRAPRTTYCTVYSGECKNSKL